MSFLEKLIAVHMVKIVILNTSTGHVLTNRYFNAYPKPVKTTLHPHTLFSYGSY
jgi:hypothetical protein